MTIAVVYRINNKKDPEMSTYKNTSGDLTLTGDNGFATLTINYANTVFNGGLTYTGNLTTVDDFIVVAANNTGTVTDMGLLAGINTGNGLYAGLRFDATINAWQISSNVSGLGVGTYANILTTASAANAAGSNTQIQFNQGGVFGASGNLTFDYGNNKLTMLGYQVFGNTATPANVANAVALYSNVTGSGGTGLYFTSSSANDELVSKSKAIVFAIIF
jgi:hypothetical protein